MSLGDVGLPLMGVAVVVLMALARREAAPEPQTAKVVPFPTVPGVRLVARPQPLPAPLDDACERSRRRLEALGIDPDRLPDAEPLQVVAQVQLALLAYYDTRRPPCRVRLGDEPPG